MRDQIAAFSGGVSVEGFETITVGAEGITFVGTEGTVWGPFAIPVALKPRGVWATGKTYLVNDLVQKDADLYVVGIDHISGVFADDVSEGNLVLAYHGATSSGGGGTGTTITARGVWASGVVYSKGDLIQKDSSLVIADKNHASSDYAYDLGSGKLKLVYMP